MTSGTPVNYNRRILPGKGQDFYHLMFIAHNISMWGTSYDKNITCHGEIVLQNIPLGLHFINTRRWFYVPAIVCKYHYLLTLA